MRRKPQKTAHVFRWLLERLAMVLASIGAISVLIMAAIICFDVGMRYFFNKPTSWALEISQYLMLATIFLPLALVQKNKQHITVELFTSRLPTRLRAISSEIIIPVFALLVTCGLLWQFLRLAIRLFVYSEVSLSTLRVPLFPVSIILVLGIFFPLVILVVQIINAILGRASDKLNNGQ